VSLAEGQIPQMAQSQFSALLPSLLGSSSAELGNVINQAIQPVQERLMEQVLPSITRGQQLVGQRGAGRADAFRQQALRGFGRTATDLASRLAYEDFQNAKKRQLQAALLVPSAIKTASAGPALLESTGKTGRMLEQAQADTAVQNSQLPLMELAALGQLIGRPIVTGRSGTTTATQRSGGNLLNAIVGLGSMVAGFPGFGATAGLGAAGTAAAIPSVLGGVNPLLGGLSWGQAMGPWMP